ncbi:hypothetical protein FisN_3Hh279 [Fistulifera solaris]|uniref:Glycosyltransferase family 92 protein n=1 Tax=Fistulifera solaris TaxID=1519565 RepID=A0A1Z5JQK9_FISSO|nr:hypothetical protein FisN_3Hh279 [Fistulifera solaris]|eukprot:GAX16239.1 hypothetical protein FisN_3Hh279 [Fistulifera solaris]
MGLPAQKARRGLLRRTACLRFCLRRCTAGIFLVCFLAWMNLNATLIYYQEPEEQVPADKGHYDMGRRENERNMIVNNMQVQTNSEQAKVEHPSDPSDKKILTFYLEPPSTMIDTKPLPMRKTSADILQKIGFSQAGVNCTNGFLIRFPTDEFPESDPFLPWIHDYFVDTSIGNNKSWAVKFVAQNRRRCDTGHGKESAMKFWEPQMALFQPVPIQIVGNNKYLLSSLDEATVLETRFICRFHDDKGNSEISFSEYPFNYEYINWRKHREQSMFSFKGPDVGLFEFSQLLFSCPVPELFRNSMKLHKDQPSVWMDLIPIRTPARHGERLLGEMHVGHDESLHLEAFDTVKAFGDSHFLPELVDSGRIANLPICASDASNPSSHQIAEKEHDTSIDKRNTLVLCTWTASSYHRRGDRIAVNDAPGRLREWIVFHKLAGVDHIVIYDNSQISVADDEVNTSLKQITDAFPDFVTYHPWPFKVCNNNRPNNKNPGERSSQYAAESSCRERYGPSTDWMAFIDTDEYLVPMINGTWKDLLTNIMQSSPQTKVLKMKSSRGRPREDLMEELADQNDCNIEPHRKRKDPLDPCLVPRRNETFLRVYNCDYIKPPRPDRFARAMKQIYQPSFVLSHFVHYSTITTDIARYHKDWIYGNDRPFSRRVNDYEWGDRFLDELNEGVLVHTKSVLPYETMTRSANCRSGKQYRGCGVGRVCPESTIFNDTIHQENLFVDESGSFCNCWINQKVESTWVKRLEEALLGT